MTMEQKATKNIFQLSGGLNTEATEIGFPDGFTTDEANYELLPDGTRRRRKGLAAESGQSTAKTVTTFTSTCRQQMYMWKNVAGDPTKNTIVYKQGDVLYFVNEGETLSTGWSSDYVALDSFATSGATTANLDDAPVSFAHGRGRLLVTGQYISPFYVEWDGTNYITQAMTLRIRDFTDVEDGTSVTFQPASGSLTDAHNYNLRNRGFPENLITATYDSKYPSRNMVWWRGYERLVDEATSTAVEKIGTRDYRAAKLVEEGFGTSSAPRGSLFVNPQDTTYGFQIGTSATAAISNISTWIVTSTAADPWVVTITFPDNLSLNPLGGDEIQIQGQTSKMYIALGGGFGTILITGPLLDGVHTTTGAGGAGPYTATFEIPRPYGFGSFVDQYVTMGTVDTGGSLARGGGTTHDDSTAAVEFYAGRAFYGGFTNEEWADTLFFSQIADTPVKFARCYQDNDPTDENYNSIMPTDGGHIVVPGLSGVIELRKLRESLLIFSSEGVWELSGQRGSVFLPDRYNVRQITNLGASSPDSIVTIENTILYTGPAGIIAIAPNQYTGLLEAQNIITQTIQTKWNQLSTAKQERCQAFYDDAKNRVYFMLGPNGTNSIGIDEMLIYEMKFGSWIRYTFDTPSNNVLLTGISLIEADDPTSNKKAKFIYQASTTTVNVADFAQTGFDDWDGTNGPLPYLFTGWDNIGDYQRRKQAPIITVFSRRTETGYTAGVGWDAVNPSSTKMGALWDWVADTDSYTGDTDEATTNKVGALQQVYRHVRDFVPAATTSLDGYPVVVTRNKVRGRGRVLQLKFVGEADYDSHILGFTTNYKVTRKI